MRYVLSRILKEVGMAGKIARAQATSVCNKLSIEKDAEGFVSSEDLLAILEYYRMSDSKYATKLTEVKKRIEADKLNKKEKAKYTKPDKPAVTEKNSPYIDSAVLLEVVAFCERNGHKSVSLFISKTRNIKEAELLERKRLKLEKAEQEQTEIESVQEAE